MELIGKLKKKVDKASTKEEKRELIEEAGMKLNDVELEMVSGGAGRDFNPEYWEQPGRRAISINQILIRKRKRAC